MIIYEGPIVGGTIRKDKKESLWIHLPTKQRSVRFTTVLKICGNFIACTAKLIGFIETPEGDPGREDRPLTARRSPSADARSEWAHD